MSTTHAPHIARNCIDDLTTTFCHTAEDSDTPWLSIQLVSDPLRTQLVSYVMIWNRVDCCQDKLSPLQLWVSNSTGDHNSPTSMSCGEPELNLTTPATDGPF